MSTSLLYHGFGIRGYSYQRTEYKTGQLFFHIYQETHSLRCSQCGADNVIRHGVVARCFRTIPIGGKNVFIHFSIPRVYCSFCQVVRQVKIQFAEWRKSYTHSFQRYVLELSKHMTIKDVANHLDVSWDLVKEIIKHNLQKRYARPKLKNIRLIAIDEISIGKGHRYLTIVLDLTSGCVVFVGEGKGGDALIPFFRRLRRYQSNITAVAIDMSPAYINAVQTHLPGAAIVFDHFHVIKLFNDKLSKFRRKLQSIASKQDKEVLKGTRWLLLKNPENLDKSRDELQRLEKALRLNQPLATAYYLKEDLRQFWNQKNKDTAAVFLQDWIDRAMVSAIPMLQKFAKTLGAHRSGLLNYYDFPISTGPLEGTNNKIKTMKRQAYGFRDLQFFKLKILAIHNTKYALVG